MRGRRDEGGGVEVVERLDADGPGKAAVQRCVAGVQLLHRSHGGAAEHQDKRPVITVHIVNRVELRWHALARPHEVLEFIEHDDQRLGRPELVEEPEDGAPGGVVCRVEPQVEVPCDGLHELSTIDGTAPLCRHKVESLRVRPRVREQIRLPHAPPTGDQREIWARTIKELTQLRPLTLAIHEEWRVGGGAVCCHRSVERGVVRGRSQKPNTIRAVYRLSSIVLKHYTTQEVSRRRVCPRSTTSRSRIMRNRPSGATANRWPDGLMRMSSGSAKSGVMRST